MRRRLRATGFTLIELMVTIAIVAILVALAFPSFEGSLRSNRVATTTNEMLASLSLARGEAIRNSTVGTTEAAFSGSICASANGTTCGTDWNQGWIVGRDNNGDGTFDEIIRYTQGHPRMVISALDTAGVAVNRINFDYRGRPTGGNAGVVMTMKPDTCPAAQELVREMRVNAVGQVSTGRKACT